MLPRLMMFIGKEYYVGLHKIAWRPPHPTSNLLICLYRSITEQTFGVQGTQAYLKIKDAKLERQENPHVFFFPFRLGFENACYEHKSRTKVSSSGKLSLS